MMITFAALAVGTAVVAAFWSLALYRAADEDVRRRMRTTVAALFVAVLLPSIVGASGAGGVGLVVGVAALAAVGLVTLNLITVAQRGAR